MVKYETDKGNTIEIYNQRIGGKKFWFIGVVTKKKIYNVKHDFTNKAEAIEYAKKLIVRHKI